jgi:hypothetical protein
VRIFEKLSERHSRNRVRIFEKLSERHSRNRVRIFEKLSERHSRNRVRIFEKLSERIAPEPSSHLSSSFLLLIYDFIFTTYYDDEGVFGEKLPSDPLFFVVVFIFKLQNHQISLQEGFMLY